MNDYQNKNLSIRERVLDLIGRMTLQEKVGQINQHLSGWKCYAKISKNDYEITNYLKKHLAWGQGIGALYGVFRSDPWSKVNYDNGIGLFDSQRVTNKIQKYVIENSRLHIPVLFVEECPHGHQALDSPTFPTNIGKGNSFDKQLIKKMATVQAAELKAKGVNLALVSTLDLAKDPRWGRTEECFGEDPYLSAQFSKAILQGFQGDLINDKTRFDSQKVTLKTKRVGVVLKHFIAQGEVLGGHNSGSVMIGKNEFNSVYQPLIEACKNAAGVMAAYNDIDGIPCHINKYLLTNQLRKKFGFQGIVMADGTALDRLADCFSNKDEAINAALTAGIDLSLWDDLYLHVAEAVKKDKALITQLNKAVYHVLSLKFLLGLFDEPYTHVSDEQIKEILSDEQKVNRQLAQESMTLVKNNHILPLKPTTNAAIMGPNANSFYNLLGDYTAPHNKKIKEKTVYRVLKQAIPDLIYAKGCSIRAKQTLKQAKEAEKLAQKVDVVILVLGGSSTRRFDMEFFKNGAVSSKSNEMDSGENVDLASLRLGGSQLDLLREMKKSGKKIITILIQGRPYDLTEVMKLSDAVLLSWYPGDCGAEAIRDVLLGCYNPDGKLSISYPINSLQLPVYYYQRDDKKNENYYDLSGKPLLDFGYGLHYGNLKVEDIAVNLPMNNQGKVEFTLHNLSDLTLRESILIFAQWRIRGEIPQKLRLIKFDQIKLSAHSIQKVKEPFTLPFNNQFEQVYEVTIKIYNHEFHFKV